jgi:D-alanyl-lipoteichoic acid acyltransferase DltB (MBOAT superfamily)
MLFNSFFFLMFLAVVLCIYYPLSHKAQNIFLLIASCVFYACWDWRFLFPLLFSTTIDYYCALKLQDISEGATPDAGRKKYLYLSVVTNLALLGCFKYFNFFTASMEQFLGHMGFHVNPWTLRILLPVGISFYTFQALSYTIDVYRGQLHSTRNFPDFLLAILYFPHLVAGPIQRAHSLLPQVTRRRTITRQQVADGVHLMACGYFKKVFLADNLAPIVNRIFADPNPSGFHALMAIYAFAVQIYCDFSGYTDIARGVAKLMGFEFMLNFNLPYFATNPSDFWGRWHISLSSWLRDYLYIPLGGNRGAAWKVKRNLLLTMLIGGLWHGAAWNFVLWGFYHGMLLVLYRELQPVAARIFAAKTKFGRGVSFAVSVLVMFQFTCYGWLLFRAESFHQIRVMTEALMHPLAGFDAKLGVQVLAYALPLVLVQIFQHVRGKLLFLNFSWLAPEARVAIYAMAAYFVLFLGGEPKAFIYFQF